jgi:hypothetical protein
MHRSLLAILFLGFLLSTSWGDALILKDGRKVIGRVAEKKEYYEVQVEGQTLTFDKDDVDKWIKSPREITADVAQLVDDAKKMYSEAVEMKDEKAADVKFREALPKVQKARDALTEARDLFPEGYADLDMQLVNVMKLTRLIRERIHSAIASGEPIKAKEPPKVAPKVEPPPPEPKVEPPPPEFGIVDALAILADPAKRGDEKQRAQARGFLKKTAEVKSPIRDLAAAGALFLGHADAEWKLSADAGSALQAFFKASPPDKLESLSAKEIGDGVKAVAAKIKDLRAKAVADPSIDVLSLIVGGASSSLVEKNGNKLTPELEAAFKDLGFEKSEFGDLWGRKDGLAMDDYRKWIGSAEYALGIVQFQKDYATLPETGPKYALGLLLTFKALQDNRNYNKAAVQFEILARTAPTPASRDHITALAKSIRLESPCAACAGTNKINCSTCKGKIKINLQCGKCGGSGALNTFRGVAQCPICKGAGGFKNVDCTKCKATGKVECKARGCDREVKPPKFDEFADAFQCGTCKGKGSLFRHVALACPDCLGVGLMLRPKSDPTKLLK